MTETDRVSFLNDNPIYKTYTRINFESNNNYRIYILLTVWLIFLFLFLGK